MQTFEIGTVARFKPNPTAQNYGKQIYGQVNDLMISGECAPRLTISGILYLTLCKADGSPVAIPDPYVNAAPDNYLEVDTFMHACREAIKEAECPTGADNSKS